MRVFVTGASGFVGSAVVRELLDAGHRVLGLARSDASAALLAGAGAEVHRGALEDLDALHAGAAAADGVIHLAFSHDFADRAQAGALDLAAAGAMGAALEGTGKPLVVTSGTLMLSLLAPGRLGTEETVPGPEATQPRVATEAAVLAMAGRGVRTSIVRLAPSVHSDADTHGFVPSLIGIARDKGVAAFVGDGSNRWPGVHQRDAARLFRLALENAPAGSVLHGTGEEGVPFRAIAEAIGRGLGLPVAGVPAEEAAGHFGWMSAFAGLDNPTSSALTRKNVGWHPQHPTLLEDLDAGHYFRVAA